MQFTTKLLNKNTYYHEKNGETLIIKCIIAENFINMKVLLTYST